MSDDEKSRGGQEPPSKDDKSSGGQEPPSMLDSSPSPTPLQEDEIFLKNLFLENGNIKSEQPVSKKGFFLRWMSVSTIWKQICPWKNSELLLAVDKYNILGLLDVCVE